MKHSNKKVGRSKSIKARKIIESLNESRDKKRVFSLYMSANTARDFKEYCGETPVSHVVEQFMKQTLEEHRR